jgi:SET domain-containing protein
MKTEYNYIPQQDEDRRWKIKDVHDGRGFGVYTDIYLDSGQVVGDTHYTVDNMAIAITELGKFHNHSEEPNCEAIPGMHNVEIVAIRDISIGEELTVNYQDYEMILNIEKPNNWKKIDE